MAKHMVKCFFCGQLFDANKEPFVMANSRRYAHKICAEKNAKEKTEEELDKEKLEDYIKQLFNITKLTPKINKQIKAFKEENQYSYSGMLRCLIYFYDIQNHSIEKANNGIGIIPYVWENAYNYYYNLWLAQQKNENKILEEYAPKEIIIQISPPERKLKKRKLFTFLDDKETDNI